MGRLIFKKILIFTFIMIVDNCVGQENLNDSKLLVESHIIHAQELVNNSKLSDSQSSLLDILLAVEEICVKNNLNIPDRYYYFYYSYYNMLLQNESECLRNYSDNYALALKFGKIYLNKTEESKNPSTIVRRTEIINKLIELNNKVKEIEDKNKKVSEAYLRFIGNIDTVTQVKTLSSFLQTYCEPCEKHYAINIIKKLNSESGETITSTNKIVEKLNTIRDFNAYQNAIRNNTIESYDIYIKLYKYYNYGKYYDEVLQKRLILIEEENKIADKKKLIKNIFLGYDRFGAIAIKSNLETTSLGLIFGPLFEKFKNIGLCSELISYNHVITNPYLQYDMHFLSPTLYLSPKTGGSGFILFGGYDGLNFNKTGEEYFKKNTSLVLTTKKYDRSELKIKHTRWFYGFGYQNKFKKLFIGFEIEFFYDFYKAEPIKEFNYKGLNEKNSGVTLNFVIGITEK